MNKHHQPHKPIRNQPVTDSVQDSTPQQRNQEALRKSEEKYRRLFDSIDEAFCTIEVLFDNQGKAVDYRFLETNPAFLRQTGLHNVIGQRALDFVPELEPFWFDTYGHVAKTGEAIRFEHQALAMNRYYDVYAFRVDEPNQNHIAVIFNDVSRRKRHEANLAFLADVSQDLALLTDIDQTMNALGQKIAAYLGLSASSFAELHEGANPETLTAVISHGWCRDDVPSHLSTYRMDEFMTPEVMQRCLAGQAVVIRDVFEDPRTNGKQYAGLHIGSFIGMPLVQDGQWRFLLVIYRSEAHDWSEEEITLTRELTTRIWTRLERAKAEAALLESQKRFESIANLVPDLLWDSAPDGSTNWYNQRWLAYTGQRFDEAIGWGWTEAIHPDDREASDKRYDEAVAVGQSLRQEHRIRRHDGAYRWFAVSASPLKDQTGQVVKMYGAATDIHESKLLEADLLEADRRKDEFLAMLAHELRNPLAPVRNGLQLLAQTHQDDQTLGTLLPIMNRQMDHLMHMLDDLLDISRISRGTIKLHKKRIDLAQVVTQAVDVIQPLYTASGRQLTAQLPNDPLYLDGDSTRLHQVVTNLLTNGLRYTPEAGQVWLNLEALGEQAVLRVSDNGIGLAADQLAAIFELFVQVNTSLARSHGGLGLGLALVQELVQQHGGRVEAHSRGLEQGSEFVIYLPILPT